VRYNKLFSQSKDLNHSLNDVSLTGRSIIVQELYKCFHLANYTQISLSDHRSEKPDKGFSVYGLSAIQKAEQTL